MQELKCSSCQKQRAKLNSVSSKLKPSMRIYMCNECIALKREPRWLIILTGKQEGGFAKIEPYIRHHRYCGEPITAKQLL